MQRLSNAWTQSPVEGMDGNAVSIPVAEWIGRRVMGAMCAVTKSA